MLSFLRAVARMPASLWVIASCGVLAGAMVAQEARSPASAPAAPPARLATATTTATTPPAPVVPVITPITPNAQGTPTTAAAPAVKGTPLRLLGSPPAAADASAATPTAPREAAGGSSRVVLIVLLLIAGAAALFFIKRQGGGNAGAKRGDKGLKVVSTVRIGGRWQVALVQVPGKTLVLGATDKGLTLLTTLEPEDELDAEALLVPPTDLPVGLGGSALPPIRPPLPTRTPRPSSSPSPDAFLGKLLDELQTTTAPASVRERPLTPSAEALRQRLERYQRKAS